MAAIAHAAPMVPRYNPGLVEGLAANAYVKRQAEPTPAITTAPVDDAGAISTLLSAYMSANPSLHTANAEVISMISSFAEAQAAYNSALERGETPLPPTLPVALSPTTGAASGINTGSTTVSPASGTGTTSLARPTNPIASSTAAASQSAAPTGAAAKAAFGIKVYSVLLVGVIAGLVAAA